MEKELEERLVREEQYVFDLKGEDDILNGCVDGVSCSKKEHAVNNRVCLIVASGAFIYEDENIEGD